MAAVICFQKWKLITLSWLLHMFPQKTLQPERDLKRHILKYTLAYFWSFSLSTKMQLHDRGWNIPRNQLAGKTSCPKCCLCRQLATTSCSLCEWHKYNNDGVIWNLTSQWKVGIFFGFVAVSSYVMAESWHSRTGPGGHLMQWSHRLLRWDLENLKPPWTARHPLACSDEWQRGM